MVDEIIGKSICGINRAADIVEISIGEEIIYHNYYKNNLVRVHKYDLHIQTFFRIRKKEVIEITSEDIYCEIDKSMDWDIQNNNKFDEWLSNADIIGRMIDEINVNEVGDILIKANEYYIECINSYRSGQNENWRLIIFDEHSSEHFVCTTNNGLVEIESL